MLSLTNMKTISDLLRTLNFIKIILVKYSLYYTRSNDLNGL